MPEHERTKVSEHPQVIHEEHRWIPMPDGTRLSARLWLPQGGPCPAILEYIPYRKRDMVRPRDERNHPYFAAHGYACLRVDMRGSGDSEGIMPDMYDQNELDDARQVIEWIAAQPWCTGRVGMFGTSWGGTASLQAAVDAPDPLKAVIANCATIDRFEDDIHWMGGCLLTDSLEWSATLPAILAAPPDSATVGEGWMEMWKSRLEGATFPLENWIQHSRRGQYWRHGSVRFEADRLSCPILTIGGWSDRYSNSVMRLVRARPDLCRGIVGPWGHHYPDHGEPGPAISFQEIALEWWDHWLKSEHPAESKSSWPALRLWRREFDPPQDRLQQRNGTWIELDDPDEAAPETFHLGSGTLSSAGQEEACVLKVPFDLQHGECAGDTGYFGRVGGLPLDQSPDDARSLCFDTEPLVEDMTLVGHAVLAINIQTDRIPAQIACRLCEVTPDGQSNLVTRTVLALELDEMLDETRSISVDQPNFYRITFPSTAYRFQTGNRIRLAIGASYWPLVWPVHHQTDLHIHTDQATLALPRQPSGAKERDAPFPPPADLPVKKPWEIHSDGELQRINQTIGDKHLYSDRQQPRVTLHLAEIGVDFSWETNVTQCLRENDPTTAICFFNHQIGIKREDGEAVIQCKTNTVAHENTTVNVSDLKVYWNDKEIHSTNWSTRGKKPQRDHWVFPFR